MRVVSSFYKQVHEYFFLFTTAQAWEREELGVPIRGAKKHQDFLLAKESFVIEYLVFGLQWKKDLRKDFPNVNGNLSGTDGTALCLERRAFFSEHPVGLPSQLSNNTILFMLTPRLLLLAAERCLKWSPKGVGGSNWQMFG